MIIRLESYKIAKLFLTRLPEVFSRLDAAYQNLLPFAVFSPVASVLRSIRDERKILEIKQEQAEKIVSSYRSNTVEKDPHNS
jgi:hypothetical protein